VLAQVAAVNLDFFEGLTIPMGLIILGLVYFILGYLLFATLVSAKVKGARGT
jgi:uncharacterized integral membrane protein